MIVREIKEEFEKAMKEHTRLCIKYKIHQGVRTKLAVPFMRFHLKLFGK